MASLKHLKWLIIPVFAILLMSHNTYAVTLTQNVELLSVYYTTFSITPNQSGTFNRVQQVYGPNAFMSFQLNFDNLSCNEGDYLVTNINFFNTGENNSLDAWVSSLYGGDNDFSFMDLSYEQLDNSTGQVKITTICTTTFTNTNKILVFSSATGAKGELYAGEYMTTYFTSRFKVINESANQQQILSELKDVSDAINNQTEKEEEASDNISNQSADDYEMESANMSSLFSQFGNFISAVNGASVGDCNIPADFNHIDLGILNLCANPVPDYVQVAVSIVSCMLIAPYLMNIIKRILSIADKIREV